MDRCRWRGRDCAFKRIEFDCDVECMQREIATRETLLRVLAKLNPAHGSLEELMQQEYDVFPILAVVVSPDNGPGGD